MHFKKRYLVVALFLLIGLTTATFANPIEELDSQKTLSKEPEEITRKEERKNTYSQAIEAVEIAEENPTLDTIENARIVIQNVENLTNDQAQQLQTRVEEAEEMVDVAALVEKLETLIEEKETLEEAKAQYPTVEAEISRLNEGNVKDNLQTRIKIVESILNDTEAPTITGITNGSIVNQSENIYINDKFLEKVKITGPNSKGEVVTKEYEKDDFTADAANENFSFKYKANYEGVWTVVATDKAGNTRTETFTIDRTAPTATITKSNKDKATNEDVIVTLKTEEKIATPEGWTVVTEGLEFTKVYSEKGKYEVEIKDKTGNKSTIKFEVKRIDKVAPTATVTKSNNDKSTNQDVIVTIIADEAIYKPAGWTEVKTNKEHEFTKVYSENGKYEVEIKDKAGNKSTIKFEVKRIDKVAPVLTVVDPNKYQLEVHSEYVDKGYSVWDKVDKDVTKLTKITYQFQAKGTSEWKFVDELDTSKLGTYKVIYTAYDKAKNTAKGTRVVEIVDTTIPVFISDKEGVNEDGVNPLIKVQDNTEVSFKVYRKGNDTPIHEFEGNTCGNTFTIGWHGAGIYTIVAIDAGGNKTSKEFEVYHNLNTVEAIEKAFEKGGKAVLTKNVTLNKAVELKEKVKLEIDLNGYELKVSNPLSDTYDKNDSNRLIKNKGNLVIKNGNLTNEKIHSYGIVDNYGTLLVEKIKVQDNGSYDGSTIKNREGKVIIADSEFNITSSAGYKTTKKEKNIKFGNAATYSDGELEIRNTSIKSDSERAYTLIVNSGTAKVDNVNAKGYHGGLAANGGTITINNMKYESDVHYGIYVSNKNETDITINGGEFIGQLQGLLIYNEFDKADVKVTVNGGTFRSKTGASAVEVLKNKATHKMDLIIKGGKFENTKLKDEYIADGYAQNESYEVVKNSISVTTGNQLKELFSNAKNVEGKTIVLENDLDMEGIEWNALDNVSFILDGNDHTIKNLTYTTNDYIGIFVNHSAANNLKFKNLTIDNANLKTTSTKDNVAAGFFVGDADTADSIIIENCTVKNSTLTAYDYAGGFIGYTAGWNVVNDGPVYSDILIENCTFTNNTITAGGSVGGAVAHAGGNPDTTVTVKNFTAKNNVLNGQAGRNKTGIVIGTAHVGKTILENITQTNNTVLGVEKSNTIYGRFVPNSTGTLTIDGVKIIN